MKRILLTILVILILGCAGAAYWVYKDLHTPVRHGKSDQYIDIPRGSSPSAVVRKLAAEGVIKHEWPLAIYIKLTGSGSRLKAANISSLPRLVRLASCASCNRANSE